jgi:formylglycine-generating enzyme required for sulfatase activity
VNVLSIGDTVLSDTSDTFAVAELYQPESPKNVSVEYENMTARISWVPVTGVGITGYRAYLYNAYGDSIGFMDVPDSSGSAVYFIVSEDSAYKVNVVTISAIGMSRICSTFVYDMTTSQDTGFRLPYLYLSTFTTPSVDSGVSTILGKGNMLGIKGGIFAMGDIWSNGAAGNGKPVHEVVVSSFYLSRSEISNNVYVQFLNDYTGLQFDTANSLAIFTLNGDTLLAPCGQFIYDTSAEEFVVSSDTAVYPVTGVHWAGAAAFCNWLSEKDYLTPWYDTSDWSFDSSANGYRLPTEAEYEYVHSAAFLGTKQRYPWGYNDIPDNYGSAATGFKKVANFGAYFGFYDLSGNVLEWCHDWSDHLTGPDSSYYTLCLQKGIVFNPYGPDAGSYHVLRGGSYLMSGEKCTSAYRHVNPGSDVTGYGFRVARRYR